MNSLEDKYIYLPFQLSYYHFTISYKYRNKFYRYIKQGEAKKRKGPKKQVSRVTWFMHGALQLQLEGQGS